MQCPALCASLAFVSSDSCGRADLGLCLDVRALSKRLGRSTRIVLDEHENLIAANAINPATIDVRS
jgi:hypothetical protein